MLGGNKDHESVMSFFCLPLLVVSDTGDHDARPGHIAASEPDGFIGMTIARCGLDQAKMCFEGRSLFGTETTHVIYPGLDV